MIPSSHLFHQSTIAALRDHNPLIAQSRALCSLLDWSVVDAWQARQSPRGRPGHPMSASLKAFLVRITQGLISTAGLRDFLLKHPLLVIELGFHLLLDPALSSGVDVEASLPTRS